MLLAIVASYGLLAAAAIVLTRLSGGIAMLWVATAPLLAVLLARRPRHWRGPVLAAMLGNLIASLSVSPLFALSLPIACCNMFEAMLGAALLRRWRIASSPLGGSRALALFVLGVGVIAPAVSGLMAAPIVGLSIGHGIAGVWLDWVIGHGLGSLIATPVALLALEPRLVIAKFGSRVRLAEAGALTALVAGVTWIVFRQDNAPLLFVVSLPVLVATIRFQRLGAAASVAMVALIGGGMTLAGHGPVMLVEAAGGTQLQFFQLFLAAQFLLSLPVAAILSERAALHQALAESEARYRLVADNVTDAMLTLDPDGTIRFASEATRELGFFAPVSLIGRNALSLVIEEDRERVRAIHLAALRRPEESFTVEYRIRKADRAIAWFETNTRAVAGEGGEIGAVVSVVREIGVRKAREAELQRQATTDPLTGLLNRGAIRARIDAAAAADHPAILAMLDLDHFKRINDTSGHETGDAVLLAFADLLHDSVRPGDSVGRIGGEEFAIVFANLSPAQAHAACERLRAALAAIPLAMGAEGPIFVTASIGLADLSGSAAMAVRAADAALYAAKARGRDRIELAAGIALTT